MVPADVPLDGVHSQFPEQVTLAVSEREEQLTQSVEPAAEEDPAMMFSRQFAARVAS
jgi:hypothetical protein